MIQLKIITSSNSGIDYYPETVYKCENCGTRGTFYSISPHICHHCHHKMPDLRQLKFSEKARKTYYLARNSR